jgi:inorganic triphosphatase YgiF
MDEDAQEIELALRVAPPDAERLLASPELAAMRRGPARRMRLISTYYDTPDESLKRAGAVLRVRRGKGRRAEQTLKTAPPPGGPAIARGEWTRSLRATAPDLGGAAERAALAAIGLGPEIAAELRPVYVTAFERVAVPIAVDGARLELAVDRGEIRVGASTLPICDLEIELVEGKVADVYAAALRLMTAVPLALQPLAKSARAQTLRAGPPQPMRAERPRLARRADIGPAFRGILHVCLAQLRANAAAIEGGDDPLAVHQFRVALRRVRSAFSAFAGVMPAAERRRFAAGLRAVARRTDAARELDVFATEILPALRRRLGDAQALDALDEVVARTRATARERVRALLCGPDFARTVLRLEAWIEGDGWRQAAGDAFDRPARGYARDMLRRLHRKLLRDGRRLDELDMPALHRVRLRAKKLRYAAEFFRDLFPGGGARDYLAQMAAVQDRLGAINDSVTIRALLARLARTRTRDRAGVERAAALVLGWCAAREQAELETLPRAWRGFAGRKPFWA